MAAATHRPRSIHTFLGRVVTPDAVIDDGAVVTASDRIVYVGTRANAPTDTTTPQGTGGSGDARGSGSGSGHSDGPADTHANTHTPTPQPTRYVLPGLVDIHNHGGGGESFPDAETIERAAAAAREHLRHGTTTLVASLVTADGPALLRQAAMLADLVDGQDLAGIHAEGPFISPQRPGAQNPNAIVEGNIQMVRELNDAARGNLTTMTLAPEVPGILGTSGVSELLVQLGAIPSLGHTDCSGPQMSKALRLAFDQVRAAHPDDYGRRPTVTHLFNAMRPVHHREPGPALSALAVAASGRAVVELVADGVHLHPAVVSDVFALIGADSIALVTDAMAAAGMPDGDYVLGSLEVKVSDGVARLTSDGAIAGGTAHLLDVVRRVHRDARVPLAEAVRAASATPAAVIGLGGEVGALEVGARADILITTGDLHPVEVWRQGQRVI
jgi:N-acetylglucosamine-6-phosphate deacetylase